MKVVAFVYVWLVRICATLIIVGVVAYNVYFGLYKALISLIVAAGCVLIIGGLIHLYDLAKSKIEGGDNDVVEELFPPEHLD